MADRRSDPATAAADAGTRVVVNGLSEARPLGLADGQLLLEVGKILRPGSSCAVKITTAGHTFQLQARVRWCRVAGFIGGQAQGSTTLFRAHLELTDLGGATAATLAALLPTA